MLFQKEILDDLFDCVETFHQKEFWEAFCLCVAPDQLPYSGAPNMRSILLFLCLGILQESIEDSFGLIQKISAR